MRKKFVFKKPFTAKQGTIPSGTELILFRGVVYMNGGMVHPAYNQILMGIINDPELHKEYLEDMEIIHNKI